MLMNFLIRKADSSVLSRYYLVAKGLELHSSNFVVFTNLDVLSALLSSRESVLFKDFASTYDGE